MACVRSSAAATTGSIKVRPAMTATSMLVMVAMRNAAARFAVMVEWIKASRVMMAIVLRPMPAATTASLLRAAMVFAAKILMLVKKDLRLVMTVIAFKPMPV